MKTNELFKQYFSSFEDIEKTFEFTCSPIEEYEGDSMLFDTSSYCMTQRLFLEYYQQKELGLKAALLLFPCPTDSRCLTLSSRLQNSVLISDIICLWLTHMSEIRLYFRQTEDMHYYFYCYLVNQFRNYTYWVDHYAGAFAKPMAKKSLTVFQSLIRQIENETGFSY